MAVAAAETQFETLPGPVLELIPGGAETCTPTGHLEAVPELDVIKVSELPGDAERVIEAQHNIRTRLVGETALSETVESVKPIKSFRESILWAAQGDVEGIAMADANIGTEMVEQAYKAGNVVTIRLGVDKDDIFQHGQRLSDVQRNAYQLASDDPIMKPRTAAEANNAVRLKWLYDNGLLEENVFVRFSMSAEGVSDEKLDELKFFSSTKSISVQMDYSENGELFEEVAMVAGVKEKGDERRDREMIEGVARHFGHTYEGMSAPEIIDDGMLVPKKYVKDGVIDFVRIMDDINGGTFYGQNVPRQDYREHKKFCEERAASFGDNVVEVRQQLIAEKDDFVEGGSVNTIKASQKMAKLVSQKVAARALADYTIDPTVLGEESAENLVRARELVAAGNHHEAQAYMQIAIVTADGGSCPAALNPTALLNLADMQGYMLSGAADAIMALGSWQAEQRAKLSWHGGEKKKGKCISCSKTKIVGKASWCKGCIKC